MQVLLSLVLSSLIGFLLVAYKRPQNGKFFFKKKKKAIKSKVVSATAFSPYGMWPSSQIPEAAATGQEEMGSEASLNHHMHMDRQLGAAATFTVTNMIISS